jgi:hypothetical protein
MDEPVATLICPETATEDDVRAIIAANQDALLTGSDELDAFLAILSSADTEYIDTPNYETPSVPEMPLDWESVSQALSESQEILVGVQRLLAETFSAMGVEHAEHLRVYGDDNGFLHLTSPHPRQEEIEGVLNSPANTELRNLYQSAVLGMGLAGGLVGSMALPPELLAKIAAGQSAA